MNSAPKDIHALAEAQQPHRIGGRASGFLAACIVCLVFATAAVGLRIYCRLWRRRASKAWGWDDWLAMLALATHVVLCGLTVQAIRFGLGSPDEELGLPTHVRAVTYAKWGEVVYFVTIALAKNSIGIAVLRIAYRRTGRWVVIVIMVLSNLFYVAALLLSMISCKFLWNRRLMDGCARVPTGIPLAVMAVSTFTDAAYAIIPAVLLRGLQMPSRPKYALIAVFAMGSLTTIVSGIRFPFVKHWGQLGPVYGSLERAVWVPVLGIVEVTIGLIAASLPSLGAMFHFFDPPKKSTSYAQQWANRVTGGKASQIRSQIARSTRREDTFTQGRKKSHCSTKITAAMRRSSDGLAPSLDQQGIMVTEDIVVTNDVYLSKCESTESHQKLVFPGGDEHDTTCPRDTRLAGYELEVWRHNVEPLNGRDGRGNYSAKSSVETELCHPES